MMELLTGGKVKIVGGKYILFFWGEVVICDKFLYFSSSKTMAGHFQTSTIGNGVDHRILAGKKRIIVFAFADRKEAKFDFKSKNYL